MLADSILQTIGRTPHIRIQRLFGAGATVYIKSERSNPGGSIKDRIALAMVEAAEASGELKAGGTIVEPTSGNTGVGLAMVAAVKGYPLTLVMPESMSVERRRLMLAYGAKFVLTPREKGMNGAIARAKELLAELPGAWMPQQFENPANIDVHVRTTAEEIAADFPDGLDALITGVGTGGHLTGCAQVLKARWPKLKVYAVEPAASPVISGGAPSPHPIQGIGAGFDERVGSHPQDVGRGDGRPAHTDLSLHLPRHPRLGAALVTLLRVQLGPREAFSADRAPEQARFCEDAAPNASEGITGLLAVVVAVLRLRAGFCFEADGRRRRSFRDLAEEPATHAAAVGRRRVEAGERGLAGAMVETSRSGRAVVDANRLAPA